MFRVCLRRILFGIIFIVLRGFSVRNRVELFMPKVRVVGHLADLEWKRIFFFLSIVNCLLLFLFTSCLFADYFLETEIPFLAPKERYFLWIALPVNLEAASIGIRAYRLQHRESGRACPSQQRRPNPMASSNNSPPPFDVAMHAYVD